MNTLIIYDNTGYVISQMAGSVREPSGGVLFLWVDIPEGQQLKLTDGIGVDVSVTPNVAILEDIPPTEFETLKKTVDQLCWESADPAIILSTVFAVMDNVNTIDGRLAALEV